MALPGLPLEICFSFDTTMSMTQYIEQVKARLQSMVQKLQADIPGIRIALCAHGDFYYKDYDNKSPYEMIKLDFTDNIASLCEFIQKAEPTDGGDWEEFYEYVLKEARETLSWSVHTNKVLVLIGDAVPHSMADECNLKKIDWREEVKEFVKSGVTLYGIYCKTPKSIAEDRNFFQELAKSGGGSFLKIEDFEDIFDTLMAICYREQGETALQAYEQEVKERLAGPSRDVNKVFTTLKKSVSNASSTSNSVINKVEPVQTKTSIPNVPTVKTNRQRKQISKKTISEVAKTSRTIKTSVKQTSKAASTNKATTKHIRSEMKKAKLRREKVPETNFALRELPWSSWKPIFCNKCLTKNWTKRQSGLGYKNGNLFKNDKQGAALYEVAVRSRPRSQKVVVFTFSAPTQSFSATLDHNLKKRSMKSRLDNVLKKGCVVFVRRLLLGRGLVFRQAEQKLDIYSYLWDEDTDRNFVKDDIMMEPQPIYHWKGVTSMSVRPGDNQSRGDNTSSISHSFRPHLSTTSIDADELGNALKESFS